MIDLRIPICHAVLYYLIQKRKKHEACLADENAQRFGPCPTKTWKIFSWCIDLKKYVGFFRSDLSFSRYDFLSYFIHFLGNKVVIESVGAREGGSCSDDKTHQICEAPTRPDRRNKPHFQRGPHLREWCPILFISHFCRTKTQSFQNQLHIKK